MYQVRQLPRFPWKNRNNIPILLVVACMSMAGMSCNDQLHPEPTSPSIGKIDEFLPLDGGQKEASYSIDGTRAEYKLEITKDGNRTKFSAMSHGAVIDTEEYEVNEDTVFLRHALGETFNGPVPLLRFPLRLGDTYEWKGTLNCETDSLVGSAKIQTSADSIHLKDRSQEAVKVEVNLIIDKVGTRKLTFWFAKNMGVLKTEMGKNVREPKI